MAGINKIDGVAMANIAKVNGVAIANIAKFDGVAKQAAGTTLEFDNTTTMLTSTTFIQDGYRDIVIDGWGSGDQMDINIDISRTITSGSPNFNAYYRIDGGSWVSLGFWTTAGTASVSVDNVAYDEVVDVRIYVGSKSGAAASIGAEIKSGSWDSGSGTISIGSPASFSLTVIPI